MADQRKCLGHFKSFRNSAQNVFSLSEICKYEHTHVIIKHVGTETVRIIIVGLSVNLQMYIVLNVERCCGQYPQVRDPSLSKVDPYLKPP